MVLEPDIKTIPKYAENRIMWITPNEAKRLVVTECRNSSGNFVGVQPASGFSERVSILFAHPQSLRFIGGYSYYVLRTFYLSKKN